MLELTKCPDCGRDREQCRDAERAWYPQREVCYAKAAESAANRRYDEMHEAEPFHDGTFTRWAKDPSDEFPFHYRDGVTVYVTAEDLTPDDDFIVPRQSDNPI